MFLWQLEILGYENALAMPTLLTCPDVLLVQNSFVGDAGPPILALIGKLRTLPVPGRFPELLLGDFAKIFLC